MKKMKFSLLLYHCIICITILYLSEWTHETKAQVLELEPVDPSFSSTSPPSMSLSSLLFIENQPLYHDENDDTNNNNNNNKNNSYEKDDGNDNDENKNTRRDKMNNDKDTNDKDDNQIQNDDNKYVIYNNNKNYSYNPRSSKSPKPIITNMKNQPPTLQTASTTTTTTTTSTTTSAIQQKTKSSKWYTPISDSRATRATVRRDVTVKKPKRIRFGVILPFNRQKLPYAFQKTFPAIILGIEYVRDKTDLLSGVEILTTEADSKCSEADGPLAAIDMYLDKTADVFFGPYCYLALAPVARFQKEWRIPVISTVLLEGFNDRNQYPLLTGVLGRYDKYLGFFMQLLDLYNWRLIGFMFENNSDQSCLHTIRPFFQKLKMRGENAPYATFRHPSQVEENLIKLGNQRRIIVLCASADSVREIMIKAHELNFDNGEYVFFSIDLFSSTDDTKQPWMRKGDTVERNAMAREAYEALMIVTLRKPTSTQYIDFSKKVKQKAQTMYGNITYEGQEVNSFVGAFHDAVILYAHALNETLEAGGSLSDGYNITRRMWNRTIEGITGNVSIDENGDRNADYSLLSLNPNKNEFEVVADYFGDIKQYKEAKDRKIYWAGGKDGPPPDKPKCGFDGSLCPPSKPFPEFGIVIIVLGSILVIILIIIIIAWRHIKLESQLNEMNWRVKFDDIMIAGNNNRSQRRGSQDEDGSVSTCDTIADHLSNEGNRQLFTKTGYYNGAILAIKPIYRTHFTLEKSIRLEIKKMKDLQNDHLARFHGICIDIPNQCMLTEYCPKGSLQDVLENDKLKLDWMFRYSIMQDIVRGMSYLHSTDIKSHGNLKSSNCVVDSRFVVKITDFGLHYFRDKEEELQEMTYQRERSLLWTAPELLRMAEPPPAGTQKGDVYSFAIICQEIVYRNGAFYLQNVDLSPKEITDKVKIGGKPACRPTLEEFDCPEDELAVLIRRMWSEDPTDRPDFQSLRMLIKKMNKEGDKGEILDNLLSRMEQYANNLEALVEERTSDYLQEKKKAEELLYNMLPRQVAYQLIQGKSVSAEWYDHVTIYFSDICGFTALSAESTPMQVVDLLNDLYTCFDSVIENFDVYKVETIGDAYMVVSGLPAKNGNLHAREIARMSLCLLDNVFRFVIRHKPKDQLRLRIGMHSGAVCAGVVGRKMPRYCLFGDTVNTASRMESNGKELRIHVSPFTKEILDSFGTFELEMRGAVEMKGKGAITTYWLMGEKGSPYNIRQQGYNIPGS